MGARTKSSRVNIRELIKTPKGKGIAAGLALVLLVLAILMATIFAFPRLNNQPLQPPKTYAAKNNPGSTTSTARAGQATAPPATTTDTADIISVKSDLSDYRDPFEPIAVATGSANSPAAGGTTSSDSQSGSSVSSVDVLSLESITTVNGVRSAIVLYRGQQYTVKTGDQIDSSPFRVTDIGESNISLLYGESRLTLQVGDTIVK